MSYLFSTYGKWEIEFESARGVKVTDTNGHSYIDLTSGLGVVNLGHCHPKVTSAVQHQLEKYWHTSNLFQSSLQEQVAKQLTEQTNLDLAFFCNSGAEAIEGALKLARKFTGRSKVVTLQKSFHGRTFGAMAATGQDKIKQGYGDMLPEFVHVPLNDGNALEKAVDTETAAVLIEVIQGESGIHQADKAFLQQIQTVCEANGALFIIDEIQTGIGRTGKLFAYQHDELDPDIITVAKGLSNGLPVGAILGKSELAQAFTPGSHGTTFGGNPVSMAAAHAVLKEINQPAFLQEVQQKGDMILSKLHDGLKDMSIVKEIRGKGLMIGIELTIPAAPILLELQTKGVLAVSAGENVVRLLPPLVISNEDLSAALDVLIQTVEETHVHSTAPTS
ncbi:acetylornithine transaminase [Aureibacillus halotolerans]|uniref:Acetylornithine aminotransferase n=1 Tax=Aureibacillus halotolerans TaxID=1508390 RepID=A0A4V3D604_9BACI|nr:acetylornithine transaminase [Aureibacillus halotolerans]TDQ42107.1 acetylornithine aminotransferase [Aureibacillus halotolerans]